MGLRPKPHPKDIVPLESHYKTAYIREANQKFYSIFSKNRGGVRYAKHTVYAIKGFPQGFPKGWYPFGRHPQMPKLSFVSFTSCRRRDSFDLQNAAKTISKNAGDHRSPLRITYESFYLASRFAPFLSWVSKGYIIPFGEVWSGAPF